MAATAGQNEDWKYFEMILIWNL